MNEQSDQAGEPRFTCLPDPDYPGWHRWRLNDPTRYNEAVLGGARIRSEGPDSVRVRIIPQDNHKNNTGNIHGGITLGLMDISLFAALQFARGVNAEGSSTVDLLAQFISGGDAGKPLDSVVEVLRETRRLAFLRGLVVQDDVIVGSFSGTVRKPTSK